MATTITFANNTSLNYLEATNKVIRHAGSEREAIVIELANDAIGLDQLDTLCTEGNLATITLVNDAVETVSVNENGEQVITTTRVEKVLTDYIMRIELCRKAKLVDAINMTYEDRIYLTLGQLNFIEKKLASLGLL